MNHKLIYTLIALCCVFGSINHGVEVYASQENAPAGVKNSAKTVFPFIEKVSQDALPKDIASMDSVLSPAQDYAAELLAYLLRITLGEAGDPKYREQWRMRGLNEPLNFESVHKTMTETGEDPLDLMVLDPNILDLTTVLYHYDKRLSLYEGDYGVTSIYPASEFLAIRLLLQKKMHTGEKVNLSALMAREDLVRNPGGKLTRQDLKAMNLSAEEMKFLQEIIQSKPYLFSYLKSPAMIEALFSLGIVREDNFVREKLSEANYTVHTCRYLEGSNQPGAVKICFIPSMTDEFLHGQPGAHGTISGFQPTDFLLDMVRKLAGDIRFAAKTCMEHELNSPSASLLPMEESKWEAVWQEIEENYLGFYVADQRPYVIYPENAIPKLKQICPQANFFVIILGKNVYRSIYFDQESDSFPSVNLIYMDITDIKHTQTEEDVASVACFITKGIVDRILREATRAQEVENGQR